MNAHLKDDLDEAKRRYEEANLHTNFLKQKLAKSENQCKELAHEVELSKQEIEQMKEQSVNVLEEQLQRINELEEQNRINTEEIAEREKEISKLKAKLASAAKQEDTLKTQLQDFHQLRHKQRSLEAERDLLQQTMQEKEEIIEKLEKERTCLQEQEKILTTKVLKLQQQNTESSDSLTNLDQELKKAAKMNEDYQTRTEELQKRMRALEEDNDRLKESIDEMQEEVTAFKRENQQMKVEHTNEVSQSRYQDIPGHANEVSLLRYLNTLALPKSLVISVVGFWAPIVPNAGASNVGDER